MIHKETLDEYDGSLEDLAEAIGNLRYDALANFLRLLSAKVERDRLKDKEKKRYQLASLLSQCSVHLAASSAYMAAVWKLCEPFMRAGDRPDIP